MTSLPAVNWLPYTVNVAVAVDPEPDRVAVPSDVLPVVKDTAPVGVMLLPAAFTVAVSVVWLFRAKLEGLAVTLVVVPTTPVFPSTPTDSPRPRTPIR